MNPGVTFIHSLATFVFTKQHVTNFSYVYTRKQTALDQGQTNNIRITHDLDLDLQSPVTTVINYSHAKVLDQRL